MDKQNAFTNFFKELQLEDVTGTIGRVAGYSAPSVLLQYLNPSFGFVAAVPSLVYAAATEIDYAIKKRKFGTTDRTASTAKGAVAATAAGMIMAGTCIGGAGAPPAPDLLILGGALGAVSSAFTGFAGAIGREAGECVSSIVGWVKDNIKG